MKPPFEAGALADEARALADALECRREPAMACALEMHRTPHWPMSKYLVSRYDGAKTASKRLEFELAFPSLDDFLAAVRDEDPGALEAAVELLSRVAPGEVLPIARAILVRKPWPDMGSRVGAALSRVDDPASVALALEHLDVPYVAGAIRSSICERAADAVLARLSSSPALSVTAATYERSETMVVEALLAFLGRHRIERAWDVVARLYREHPNTHVRLASGHALVAYGDERSLDVLTAFLGSDAERRLFFAVRAHLLRNPAHVVDALGGLETLGGVEAIKSEKKQKLVVELLGQAARRSRDEKKPIADAQLLDLALRWIKRPKVKDVALSVAQSFDEATVTAAKKRAPSSGTQEQRRPTKRQVAEVARIMRLARSNLENIVAVLEKHGYSFNDKTPLAPASTTARKKAVRAIETALGGPLPVSIAKAFEHIGGSDLTGQFPGQPKELESDAFVLVEPAAALQQAEDEGSELARVSLALAPDAVGKAGFSGGQEYVLVPELALDTRVLGVPNEPMFLDRLRQVFACGGFPGLIKAEGALSEVISELQSVCDPLE